MSNIVIHTQQENKFFQALVSTKVRELTSVELQNQLLAMLAETLYTAGQRPDENELSMLSLALESELRKFFPSMGIEEVKLAFQRGVRKEYGDYFGFNLVAFHNWLKSFKNDHERVEAIKQKSQMQQEEPKPPTPEKMLQCKKDETKRLFEQVKNTGDCFDIFNIIYDFLDANGFISYSKEEKWKFYSDAKGKLLEQANRKFKTDTLNRIEIKKTIENLTNETDKNRIVSTAKNLTLIDFFTNKVENMNELEILLDSIEIN